MANRTTPQLVLAQVPQVEQGFDVVPFISQAHRIIDRVLFTPGEEIRPDVLTDLETYLAAHLVTVVKPVLASESGTGISGSYSRGPVTKGLDSTPAGQICKALDETGLLASAMLGKQPFILEAFGT